MSSENACKDKIWNEKIHLKIGVTPLLVKRWERGTLNCLVMFRGEWLIY